MKKPQINPLTIYSNLLLNKTFYSKLELQTYKDMLKFNHQYKLIDLRTYHLNIDELIEFYERIESRNFMCSTEEILIDLIDEYYKWFKVKRGTLGSHCKLPANKQLTIMFKRLQELYLILKPIRNEFKIVYDKIESYKEHRTYRHSLIMKSRKGRKLNEKFGTT